jgi:uncharacterized surface protein with fasciclin (FAS1) repeats
MRTTKTLFVAVAASAALLLAACSSSSDSATEPAASASMSSSAASESPMASATAAGDIVAVASSAPELSTLVTAVGAAGLAETLQGDGPFTVFAPTNDAFDALPAGVLDKLVKPENKKALVDILTYHAVAGAVPAAEVKDGKVATVQGGDLELSTASGVTVNGAKVVKADIMASNGVVHEIDAVLLPEGFDPATLK